MGQSPAQGGESIALVTPTWANIPSQCHMVGSTQAGEEDMLSDCP